MIFKIYIFKFAKPSDFKKKKKPILMLFMMRIQLFLISLFRMFSYYFISLQMQHRGHNKVIDIYSLIPFTF